MITYVDRIKSLQKYGVLLHISTDFGEHYAICTQTGWTFFKGHKYFIEKQLKLYNIPIVVVYKGPLWYRPIPNWSQVSFNEANRLRNEYQNRWNK